MTPIHGTDLTERHRRTGQPLSATSEHSPLPWRQALILLLVLLGLVASVASAHEYYLVPSTWTATPGDTVTFGAWVGEGFTGERRRYAPERAKRLVARASREWDLVRVADAGDSTWARFAPVDSGGLLIAYESDFTSIVLEAEAFERYLTEDGLDGPLEARRARNDRSPGRERYRRCAKAWLGGSDASRVTQPIGLPLEIVPLAEPGTGPALRVRVLFEGRPLAGTLLRAWCQPSDTVSVSRTAGTPVANEVAWSGRTDARGEAVVSLDRAGGHLLSTVHMVPSRDTSAADWESTWSSLTFERGARRRAEPLTTTASARR
jgi:uncharacterized GH25 family protein